MRRWPHNTAKLPRQLLEELGISGDSNVGRNKRTGPVVRKERRKVARIQKKARNKPSKSLALQKLSKQPSHSADYSDSDEPSAEAQEHHGKAVAEPIQQPKSILKRTKSKFNRVSDAGSLSSRSPSPPSQVRVSQWTKDRLATDDAEIAALERALGVKGKKKLPKAFEEDGLNGLLDGLDDAGLSDEVSSGKRKRAEGDEWLERKRQKALRSARNGDEIMADITPSVELSGSEEGSLNGSDSDVDASTMDVDEDEAASFGDINDDSSSPHAPRKTIRENPYIAPKTTSDAVAPAKYIPPSLRDAEPPSEDLSRLRRKIQGLLNRISEANILSILRDVEMLYRDHPRQHVSKTLLDLLMGLLCDPTSLQDTFIILHAGFIAAIYRVIGMDFGAQAIQRVDEEFVHHYQFEAGGESKGKRLINLMSLLSELYNFQVIGSNLIYDFVRFFLEDLTETNAELLLKIMRSSGLQLRQDDPSSLKNIVLLLQQAIEKAGEKNLSVRTKFMIEIIYNIKNNRVKTGVAASAVNSEHTIRMKKILGSLNTRTIKASEPLRVGLKDIRESDKRGKWWLIGASYKDNDGRDRPEKAPPSSIPVSNGSKGTKTIDSAAADLIQLAKEQRINTDVRRSIFIAIMSATDCDDAYLRLQKLRLKKKQEQEIPKVLIHCSGAEKSYNPFYTLVARKVCSGKKLKMGFQLSLWDLFRRMGDGDDDDDDKNDDDSDDEDALGLRCLVNLAKMFGTLVAEGGLGLGILKILNFAYLQPKTRTFVELMLITVFLRTQRDSGDQRLEAPIIEIFVGPKEAPAMARGLQYFLQEVVSKTDVAGSKHDRGVVRWGCKVAVDALKAVASSTVAGG